MTSAVGPAPRPALSAPMVWMIGLGAVAWLGVWAWVRSEDMGAMPGTMGLGVVAFVAMWSLMMAAVMLPSVAPVASLYSRTITDRRGPRLTVFGGGYLLAWAATGVLAFALAEVFEDVALGSTATVRVVGATTFAVCGIYQLTPLKDRCLRHCRSPLTHLFHYASFRGRTRDLRAGVHHSLYCLGCCWTLMVVMVAFGVMNLLAMAGLAVAIGLEKHWRHGRLFARAVGVAALVLAVMVVIEPGVAPGLDPGGLDAGGAMETEMPASMP
jgi:predicted metal-binding membrane protein